MTFRALTLAGVLLALVGCTAPAGARLPQAASPQPPAIAEATASAQVTDGSLSVQPVTPPQPLPEADGCGGYGTFIDQILSAPAKRIAGSDQAFTGVIVEIGEAQWNTVDSAPPKTKLDYNARHVFRLVRVQVATSVKGDAGGEVVVAIEGGKIGCNTFLSDPGRLDLEPGQTFLWLARNDALRAKVPAVPVVHALWVVDGDGNVAVPMSGDGHIKLMPLDEVLKTTS